MPKTKTRSVKEPKPKLMTFVYQDMDNNTINTLEWKSTRRTIEEAWDDARYWLGDRAKIDAFHSELRFAKVLVFDGLCKQRPESVPLRMATREELKTMEAAS